MLWTALTAVLPPRRANAVEQSAEQLRQLDITFRQFKRSLKTFVLGYLGRGVLCLNLRALTRNLLTYLLTHILPD